MAAYDCANIFQLFASGDSPNGFEEYGRLCRMRFRRIVVPILGIAAIASALAWERLSAEAQQDPGGTATLQIYPRRTVVDVTEPDAAGIQIYGLQEWVFKILEDGKPQTIQNFEEVGL